MHLDIFDRMSLTIFTTSVCSRNYSTNSSLKSRSEPVSSGLAFAELDSDQTYLLFVVFLF